MAKGLNLSLQAIAARAGLIAEPELLALVGETTDEPGDDLGTMRKHAELADIAIPTAFRHGHGDRRLVDVHPDKHDAAHQARSPCKRLSTGQPGATLARCMLRSGPPVSGRKHRV